MIIINFFKSRIKKIMSQKPNEEPDEKTSQKRCSELLRVVGRILSEEEKQENWLEISRLLNIRNIVNIIRQCNEEKHT